MNLTMSYDPLLIAVCAVSPDGTFGVHANHIGFAHRSTVARVSTFLNYCNNFYRSQPGSMVLQFVTRSKGRIDCSPDAGGMQSSCEVGSDRAAQGNLSTSVSICCIRTAPVDHSHQTSVHDVEDNGRLASGLV